MTTADVAELPVAEKQLLMERLWDALRVQPESGVVTEAKERIRAQIKAG